MIEFDAALRDRAVPWHLGDPFAESRALRAGEALVDLSHYEVIRVGGAGRRTWLHLLVTQAVDVLEPGQSCHALVLSAQGHIEHDLKICDDGEYLWLIVEPDTAASLLAYLQSMVFMYEVTLDDMSAQIAVYGGFAGSVATNSIATWSAPVALSAVNESQDPYVPHRPAPWPAMLSLVPRATKQVTTAGLWAWESLRVAAAVPRIGIDTDHRSLPHEFGLIGSAVHLHKGCYRGQEAVARTINLGRPPRRLVQLHLDGATDELPTPGGELRALDSGLVVGRIGSSTQHFEDGPLALAIIKRSVALGAELELDGPSGPIRASQIPVVVIN